MPQQVNIMVIEPDDINRSLAAEILQSQQYGVLEAADFWTGVSTLAKSSCEVMLLEKNACFDEPERVYGKILTLSAYLPIILFCSNLTRAELKQYMMLGIYGFINKPYNRERLLTHVGEAAIYKQSLDRVWSTGG